MKKTRVARLHGLWAYRPIFESVIQHKPAPRCGAPSSNTMKHTYLALGALLLLAPAGALLTCCGGGGSGLSNTAGQNLANLSIIPLSGANLGGPSTFTASKIAVYGDSSSKGAGFSLQYMDASQREIDFDGTAITSGSFSVGQSFDLTQNEVFAFSVQNGTNWGGLGAQGGTLSVQSVSGTLVTFQLTNLVLSPLPNGANGAVGTLTLNGTLTATIPVTATNPIPAALKRKSG